MATVRSKKERVSKAGVVSRSKKTGELKTSAVKDKPLIHTAEERKDEPHYHNVSGKKLFESSRITDLTCYSIPMKMSFWINSLRKAKERLLESSIYHTVTLMTLFLLIIKDLRSSFPIFTPKNSQFLKPQNLLQLLLISICFSS